MYKVRIIIILSVVLGVLSNVHAEDDTPKCHVYLDQSGWTTNVRDQVKAQYSTQNLCESVLSGYPCYTYFETREGCSVDDESLVDTFIRDARRDGHISE